MADDVKTSTSAEQVSVRGQQVIRLAVKAGNQQSTAEIYAFGAHVTQWSETGAEPFLFLSQKAKLDGTKAIRGGIPIIFPQFGPMGPLQSHGFARNVEWKVLDSGDGGQPHGCAFVELELTPNDYSKKMWDHQFKFVYRVELHRAKNSILRCHVTVHNGDDAPLPIHLALHTYFNVKHINDTTVGAAQPGQFKGLTYLDQLTKTTQKSAADHVEFEEETDRIYQDTPDLQVTDGGNKRRIVIKKTNLPDAIIWNPWIAKSKRMGDFGDDEYLNMVCVEAAQVVTDPLAIAPGKEWKATLEMFAETV